MEEPRNNWRVWAAVVMFTSITLSACADTYADDQGKERILYDRAPDDRAPWPVQDIYLVNADGTDDKALTNDGHSHSPQWSPDGQRILFVHDGTPKTKPSYNEFGAESYHPLDLYVMNRDGSNPQLLLHTEGGIRFASWSHDGKAVTATMCPDIPADAKCGVVTLPSDGRGEGRLVLPDALYGNWSPDGTKLAWAVRGAVGHPEIAVANADGSDRISLIKNADAYKYMVFWGWSPDSKRTVYSVAVDGGNFEIYAANADGSDPIRLIDPKTHPSSVNGVWSPDGKKIAFDAYANQVLPGAPTIKGLNNFVTEHEIFLVNADGSGLQQFTTDPEWGCLSPAWSPDGKRLAFFCRAASAPCSPGRTGPPDAGLSPCVRRVFVVPSSDPVSKLSPIIEHDGAGPKFAPQ